MSKAMPMQDLINSIIVGVVAYETQRHQQCIDSISRRNTSYGTFLHGGRTYKVSNTFNRRVALHESLWPDMEKFLIDYDKLAEDSKGFWQSLFNLLEPCESLQDARDALPDFIVELFSNLVTLPRLREEAWTIIGNPRAHRQYLIQREKMEFYVTIQKNPSLAALLNVYNFEG